VPQALSSGGKQERAGGVVSNQRGSVTAALGGRVLRVLGLCDGGGQRREVTVLPTPDFVRAHRGGAVISTAVDDFNADGSLTSCRAVTTMGTRSARRLSRGLRRC